MPMQIKSENSILQKKMISYYNNDNLRLPRGIDFFKENDDCLRMLLSSEKVENNNMQIDQNAFEGWAIAVYAALEKKGKIILDVYGKFNYESYEKHGHLGRFLYRAHKFSDQYDWFELSDYLKEETSGYYSYLKNSELTNNVANGKAGIKYNHNAENAVEAVLSEDGKLKSVVGNALNVGNNRVYRQLPVGLFKDSVSKETMVFTGGKSAIDLWTWNESDFYVVELKTHNPMIGIVSEVFFYSNYMRDLLLESGLFKLNKPIAKDAVEDRGYSELIRIYKSLECINGVMLADMYHPLVNKETIDILNSGKEFRTKYSMISYNLDVKLSEI